MVHDASMDSVTLEGQDITLERWGELSVLFHHSVSGKPGDSIPGSVLVFECCLELSKKVVPSSKGHGSASDCFFLEDIHSG